MLFAQSVPFKRDLDRGFETNLGSKSQQRMGFDEFCGPDTSGLFWVTVPVWGSTGFFCLYCVCFNVTCEHKQQHYDPPPSPCFDFRGSLRVITTAWPVPSSLVSFRCLNVINPPPISVTGEHVQQICAKYRAARARGVREPPHKTRTTRFFCVQLIHEKSAPSPPRPPYDKM